MTRRESGARPDPRWTPSRRPADGPGRRREAGSAAGERRGPRGTRSVKFRRRRRRCRQYSAALSGAARSRRARRANQREVGRGAIQGFSRLRELCGGSAPAGCQQFRWITLGPDRAAPSTGTRGYAVRRGCAKSSQRGKDRACIHAAARSIRVPAWASSSASRWAYGSGGSDRRSRAMRRSASRPARVKRAKGRRPGGSTISIRPRASSVRIAVRSSLGWPFWGPPAQRCSQIPSSSGSVCPPRARNSERIRRRSAAVNGPAGAALAVEVRARGIDGGRLARQGPATLVEGSGGRRRSHRDLPGCGRWRRHGQRRIVGRHPHPLEVGAAQVSVRPGGMIAEGGDEARA